MSGLRVCIDRGGTFTDCIAFVPARAGQEPRTIVVKLLSVDPQNYSDAPREGIRRILEIATGKPHPRDRLVDTSNLEVVRMGTTVATNALLERKGEPSALIITKGFKDLLHIGNQSRPKIFDLAINAPEVLYSQVVEIDERVTLLSEGGPQDQIVDCEIGVSGERVNILRTPDLPAVRKQLQPVYDSGIRSVAICLLHSYTFPRHEQQLEQLCREIGFTNITLSSAIMPMIKIVPRGTSATADAYLTPCIQRYLEGFFSGFDSGIRDPNKVKIEFMQSDGGLAAVDDFSGFKAILSGPAGGVVGYAQTSYVENGKPVIGFDMGGTSTDVSRFAGRYEHVFETTTAGVTIQAPQLDINTVAAGGGSRLFFKNGLFVVGPESASADPGPACYRKGGPPTITDANLLLGRLIPDYFPKIFGKSEREALDPEASRSAFETLTRDVNLSVSPQKMSPEEVAYGFVKVANESMCRPIRALTQAKGYDTADHILASFGGAGGQHACAIARALGIEQILIHKYSSILSAYGLHLADVVHEEQSPSAAVITDNVISGDTRQRVAELTARSSAALQKQGFTASQIKCEVYLNLRYQGTDTALMTIKPAEDDNWDFVSGFVNQYKQEFGFTLPDRDIIIDDVRVRGIGRSQQSDEAHNTVHKQLQTIKRVAVDKHKADTTRKVYWEGGYQDTPVYVMERLCVGDEIQGPALVIDKNATIAVEPDCKALVTTEHVVITVSIKSSKTTSAAHDPIRLSIFAHRFMSIAEQMGRTLQKTAISTNIKERLDFSCALFGPDGGLVANAPHIPVHLGSMQEAVRWQMQHSPDSIEEGDVLLTNHPQAGGSHLPDITVITPVFNNGKIEFFVASRGHHADIGGIRPGSMPPDSKELFQEGAAVKSFKLVRGGRFNEEGITRILLHEPAQYPGCSGTRCLRDNISDLKAQVAANHRGITLVKGLIQEYGLDVVQAYMMYIRDNAELSVRNLLKKIYESHGAELSAVDHMDDGSPISLRVTIDPSTYSAEFDFEGTGSEVYGNTNAPRSIAYSAIIYCLRCLVAEDMPLNQGALAPVNVKIPEGCLLSPGEGAAVVGGNVLTSQRVVDVVLKAFNACAASQGCCNNFTFGKGGDGGFGYYETIAGGSGAGPTWNGRSGVHTHMTNTRITDPEIFERRYPVVLWQFGLRDGSGGAGEHRGGDGVIREIEFLEPLDVSILSERRVFAPYGYCSARWYRLSTC
ncbi:Hydantoinase B/oxoprolinase-domain-containing protein [Phlyctochytrium arcticum]|nr:Hydantoinase B/oxoprolinase-domain-containing protein [Phlyctochytrium arcticum]